MNSLDIWLYKGLSIFFDLIMILWLFLLLFHFKRDILEKYLLQNNEGRGEGSGWGYICDTKLAMADNYRSWMLGN